MIFAVLLFITYFCFFSAFASQHQTKPVASVKTSAKTMTAATIVISTAQPTQSVQPAQSVQSAQSVDSRLLDKNGKPLRGAALNARKKKLSAVCQ
jgi:hypothetical protein